MGVNCCSHDKEAPEIVIQKPERNINIDNKNPKNSQVQNDFIVVNSTQNNQTLRSSSLNMCKTICTKLTKILNQ